MPEFISVLSRGHLGYNGALRRLASGAEIRNDFLSVYGTTNAVAVL
jgi:hypothetical protein